MGSRRAAEASIETRVAVCVVTHQRPESLLRLLGAADELELPRNLGMHLIVIDNDAAESARRVCDEAAGWVSYPITYSVEKRRGIPQARNRALVLGLQDDFVAFVDDDEVPEPNWLAELVRVQRTHDADAVAGPCIPRFDAEPPAWVVRAGFFERPRFATGAQLEVAFTHNVLVRTAALAELRGLFDERMALCGGSDVELFRRLARQGFRIVWADDAVVREAVPTSRTTLRWVLRRALRVGASNARVQRLHDRSIRSAVQLFAHGCWCMAKGAALLAAACARGRPAAAALALHLACVGVGRIAGLFGLRVQEYLTTDGR